MPRLFITEAAYQAVRSVGELDLSESRPTDNGKGRTIFLTQGTHARLMGMREGHEEASDVLLRLAAFYRENGRWPL